MLEVYGSLQRTTARGRAGWAPKSSTSDPIFKGFLLTSLISRTTQFAELLSEMYTQTLNAVNEHVSE
jgi:uncharacterized protein YgiB involved in biofilm formation